MALTAVGLWRDFISQLQQIPTAADSNAINRIHGKMLQLNDNIEKLPPGSTATGRLWS